MAMASNAESVGLQLVTGLARTAAFDFTSQRGYY
jgi:hypothetical protein